MCGIFFTRDVKAFLEELIALLQLMQRRGPDAHGYYYKSPFFMGHNRLSILDLSDHANQPFSILDQVGSY